MAEGNKLADAAKKLVSDHVASVKSQTDQLRAQAKRFGVPYPQEFAVRFAINMERFPGPFRCWRHSVCRVPAVAEASPCITS